MARETLTLKGGLIVDGTGAAPFVGDICIVDGTIAEVGTKIESTGGRQIDASGLVVTPGFIDVHTHYDAQLFWDPLLGSSSQYGITTVVTGNCGFSLAPLQPGDADYLVQMLARVEGMSDASLETGVPWNWQTFSDYLDRIDQPLGANVVPQVGHSAMRYAAMGMASCERSANDEEVRTMQRLLDEAIAAGAWGFTSATSHFDVDGAGRPVPSRQAEVAEFEALADVVGRRDFGMIGLSPHSKFYGLSADDRKLLASLSKRAGVTVNWNPLIFSTGLPDLWKANLSASNEAAANGADVVAVYNPSNGGATRIDFDTMVLFAALPVWKDVSLMPHEQKRAALADPEMRARLTDALDNDQTMGLLSSSLRRMWDVLTVSDASSQANRSLVGRTVGDIARERNAKPLEVALDIAVADDLKASFLKQAPKEQSEAEQEAFATIVKSPYVVFGGSDAGAHYDMMANEGIPVRTLITRVREEGSLTLEQTIRGFTSVAAASIGLRDRGTLAPGMKADVIAFDLAELDEGEPRLVADLPAGSPRLVRDGKGIRHSIVNGRPLIEDGALTGAMPGTLLRSPA